MSLFTGVREQEVQYATWRDVDLDAKTFHLQPGILLVSMEIRLLQGPSFLARLRRSSWCLPQPLSVLLLALMAHARPSHRGSDDWMPEQELAVFELLDEPEALVACSL